MSLSGRSLLGAASLLSALVSVPVHATYSLLIADKSTGQIGSVGVSCVGRQAVSAISGIAPGFGAIHAQAQSNAGGRDRGVTMLKESATAEQIIAAITAPSFDRLAASRQYGVVTLLGSAAGYTGSANMAYADDRQEMIGSYVSSYQGNILTSAAVLDQLADSLKERGACDLPETLMLALEAGARDQQGDSRCTPGGIPADSGFLRVVDRVGNTLVSLEVTGRSTGGAVVGLREQLATWRTTHACTVPPDAGAVTDAGVAEATKDGGSPGTWDARAPLRDASSPDAQPDETSSTETPDTASGEDDARVRDAAARDAQVKDVGPRAAETDDELPDRTSSRDAGCSAARVSDPSWLLVLGSVIALRRRSRCPRA